MGGGDRKRKGEVWFDVAAVALLLGLTLVFFRGFAFTGERLLSMPTADGRTQYFGWRYYAAEALGEGRVPLWNPYYMSGVPFLAETQTAVFYPLTLLFVVLPIGLAFNHSFILHIFLAGGFTYLLLRRFGCGRVAALFGAIAFEWSSPLVLHVVPGHMSNLITLAWTPLLLLCVDALVRKRSIFVALMTAVVVAVQLLGGHAQYFYYSMLAATLFFAFRAIEDGLERKSARVVARHVGRYALAVAGGIALCSAQLLPTLELVGESVRKSAADPSWGAKFSFPPENFAGLFVPGIFGDDIGFPYWGRWFSWEMIFYVGVPTLVMGLVALLAKRDRRVYFFAGLAVVSGVLALGGYTPLLGLLRRVLPGFGMFRGHSKFIFVTALSLAILGGMGVQAFVGLLREYRREKARRVYWALGAVTAIAILLCITMGSGGGVGGKAWGGIVHGVMSAEGRYHAYVPEHAEAGFARWSYPHFRRGLFYSTALLAATAGVLALGMARVRRGGIVAAAVVVLLVVDLWTFGSKRVEPLEAPSRPWQVTPSEWGGSRPLSFPLAGCYFDEEVAGFFGGQDEAFRAMETGIPFTFLPNYVTGKVETISGVSPMPLGRYQMLFNYSEGRRLKDISAAVVPIKASKLYGILNLRYVITPDDRDSPAGAARYVEQVEGLIRVGVVTRERWRRVPPIEGQEVFKGGGLKIFENEEATPRAYAVHSYEIVNGEEAILERLNAPDFDPREAVILEEEPGEVEVGGGEGGEDEVRVVTYEAERVVVEALLGAPGFLVLADTFYPGWEATVDGEPARIYRGDFLLRVVPLGAGKHTVEFRYVCRPYRVGRWVSLGVLGLLVGGMVTCEVRRRRRA